MKQFLRIFILLLIAHSSSLIATAQRPAPLHFKISELRATGKTEYKYQDEYGYQDRTAESYKHKKYPAHEFHLNRHGKRYKGFAIIKGNNKWAYRMVYMKHAKDSIAFIPILKDKLMCVQYAAITNVAEAAPATRIIVPLLTSNGSSPFVVYINFNGDTVNNVNWYDSTIYAAQPNITTAQMAEVFYRVAEKERPFNICVTTDRNIYNKAAANKKVKADVTSTSAWYAGVGGVAYVGSFGYVVYDPAWIFSANLSNNAEYIADAVTHEVGHTFGLQHHGWYTATCAKEADYMNANGTGQNSWGATMGAPYGANCVLWYKGATTAATCTGADQDDLKIITSQNGFTYRPDDIKGSRALAISQQGIVQDSGIIERSGDMDTFVFTCNGNVKLQVHPWNLDSATNKGACLSVKTILMNSAGTVLQTDSNISKLSVCISRTGLSGTYYLAVTHAGNPNFTTYGCTGPTNYGSLGLYRITGTISKAAPPPPPCTTPKVTISPNNATVPTGTPVTITAAGANTYLWNTAATTQSITVTPTVNSTYTVTGTVTGGCTASASCIITISTTPPPPCANAPNVMAVTRAGIVYNAYFTDNGTGPYTVNVKSLTDGSITTIPNVINAPVTVPGKSGIEYSVTVTNKCGKTGSPAYFKPL